MLKKPSLRTTEKTLYMRAPPPLEEATRPNLEKKLSELFPSGTELSVTDAALPLNLRLIVTYDSQQ
jgi:ubiquitin-activating enzyme E1 C